MAASGTNVTGIIACAARGVLGIAPKAKIVAVKVLDDTTQWLDCPWRNHDRLKNDQGFPPVIT